MFLVFVSPALTLAPHINILLLLKMFPCHNRLPHLLSLIPAELLIAPQPFPGLDPGHSSSVDLNVQIVGPCLVLVQLELRVVVLKVENIVKGVCVVQD